MLGRQGSHYAPMGKGWLLVLGLVMVAAGAAAAGGLRGGPDGGRVQLRTVTTVAHSPLDVEPATTTTTTGAEGAEGITAVADDDATPGQERARGIAPAPGRTTRPPTAGATTTQLTTTTLDPDAAEEAAQAEEERLEEEEEAREDAEREARRNAN